MSRTNNDIEQFFTTLATLQAYVEMDFESSEGVSVQEFIDLKTLPCSWTSLSTEQETIKNKLIVDLFRIGRSFDLTNKEITTILFRDALVKK